MKKLRYADEFKGATGQPFPIPNPDIKVQMRVQEEAHKAGKDSWTIPLIEATFAQLMVWFCNGIPWAYDEKESAQGVRRVPFWQPKLDDNGHAYAVIRAFQEHQDGVVELSESDYTWFLDLIKGRDGATAFKVTQVRVKELLEDLVKEGGT